MKMAIAVLIAFSITFLWLHHTYDNGYNNGFDEGRSSCIEAHS